MSRRQIPAAIVNRLHDSKRRMRAHFRRFQFQGSPGSPLGLREELLGLPDRKHGCGGVVVRHCDVDGRIVAVFPDGAFEAISSQAQGIRLKRFNWVNPS